MEPKTGDKTSIEVCISLYWLQLFMHEFRDGLTLSLKMEAIFLVIMIINIICIYNEYNFAICYFELIQSIS